MNAEVADTGLEYEALAPDQEIDPRIWSQTEAKLGFCWLNRKTMSEATLVVVAKNLAFGWPGTVKWILLA